MAARTETKGRADHVDQLVSRRLKMRRMMLGLSQQDLGGAVAVSIQQVQKYEKATNRISSGKLHAFAKFLKVPVSYFFDQSDEGSKAMESVFSEEASNYDAGEKNQNSISEKEIIALVKAFSEVRNLSSRKKIIELVKTMS
jgi:transcriptional regulator with XRE-family HTH domain